MSSIINRSAVIVFPKQPVIDWNNKIYNDKLLDGYLEEKHEKGNVYLVPECDDTYDAIEGVKQIFKDIFRNELWGWCTDEKKWPKVLTWKMFNDWFDWSIQSMVIDMVDEDIEKEEF